MRSFWSALLRHVVEETGDWIAISGDIFTPNLVDLPSSPAQHAIFKAYGLIIQLTLLHGLNLLPISPFIVLFLLHGFKTATNHHFISAIAPELADRLATWPTQPTINSSGRFPINLVPGQDPMNLIYEFIPNLQVCYVISIPIFCHDPTIQASVMRTLSVDALEAIREKLYCGVIFQSQGMLDSHRQHPLLLALKEGFNMEISASRQGFSLSHVCRLFQNTMQSN
jgi:hypothetical protein